MDQTKIVTGADILKILRTEKVLSPQDPIKKLNGKKTTYSIVTTLLK
jgi:hypothetical protein